MTTNIRIAVTGGRDYNNKTHVWSVLDLHKRAVECLGAAMVLVVGDATGADYLALQWAIERSVTYDLHEAKPHWAEFGKAAGPMRNLRMIQSGINKLCAFPGNNGTKHMTDNCIANGVKVTVYKEP
jgi:hypothetical protein